MSNQIFSLAQNSLQSQIEGLQDLSSNLPEDLPGLIDHILSLQGRVITCGIGKSGYIARKIASSLASTGTPAFFVHPAEASHGDLGMITKDDLLIMLSNSGETKELFDVIDFCKNHQVAFAAITANAQSTLAVNSKFLLLTPKLQEVSAPVSAPTTSSLMAMALGDAITNILIQMREFRPEQFKIFHPGGKIGTNLLKVENIMHVGDDLPIVRVSDKFTDVIVEISKKRLGGAVVLSEEGKTLGIITDGDIRRHIDQNLGVLQARDVMTQSIKKVEKELLASHALKLMNEYAITILPVEERGKLVGLVHVHDILKRGIGE